MTRASHHRRSQTRARVRAGLVGAGLCAAIAGTPGVAAADADDVKPPAAESAAPGASAAESDRRAASRAGRDADTAESGPRTRRGQRPAAGRTMTRSSERSVYRRTGAEFPSRPEQAQLAAPASASGPPSASGPGPEVRAVAVGPPVSADPISGFLAGLAAAFDNQTPRLSPAQTAQGPDGVVRGQLNAVDPDSPILGFTITGRPAGGTATLTPAGGWTYTPGPELAAAGGVDSFRVTVSDAPSGFAIHGFAGLLHLLSFGLIGNRGDSSTATVAVTVAAGPGAGPDPEAPSAGDYVLVRRSDLMSKPTSGPGWDFLKQQADSSWGPPNLSEMNTTTQTQVLAAALVYARTGEASYRDRVIAAVREVPGTEAGADIVLPVARNLFGYAVAADLVGMPLDTQTANGQTWREFLQGVRQQEFPGNGSWPSLEITAGHSAGNWNAYALSSHLAVSAVLGDEAAVARDITIFRRFLGDTTSPWPAFNPSAGYAWAGNVFTGPNPGRTWDMTPTLQRGINPAVPGNPRSGAIIIDASRHSSVPAAPCCTMELAGRAYTEESLDALLAIATVLKARGLDVTDLENQALRRAYEYLLSAGGPSPYAENRYLALAVNSLYGTAHDTSRGDSISRHLGFGGWLF